MDESIKPLNQEQTAAPTRAARRGLLLGHLFGIEIRLDPSVVIIFLLIVSVLSLNVFPSWHPDWSIALSWGTGIAAGILFFIALLVHELAHSVVARGYGLPVPRITLFLLGGASEMEAEPDNPKQEFNIAIVGPLTSLVLGLMFTTLGSYLAGDAFASLLREDPQQAVASLTPVTTLLIWLGPVNIVLAIFNMLPGFPLDGGRVLRAIIWWGSKDLVKATRWASNAGRLFAWALMILGVLEVAAGNLSGLWLVLIGWFLSSAAVDSYRHLLVSNALSGCSAGDLMREQFATVKADLTVSQFIDEYLMQSAQQLWPVTDSSGALLGYVSLAEIRNVAAEERHNNTIAAIMHTDGDGICIDAKASALQAMQLLSQRQLPLLVCSRGQLVGLLSKEEFMKWLAVNQNEPDHVAAQFTG